jgi:hypothetical protein
MHLWRNLAASGATRSLLEQKRVVLEVPLSSIGCSNSSVVIRGGMFCTLVQVATLVLISWVHKSRKEMSVNFRTKRLHPVNLLCFPNPQRRCSRLFVPYTQLRGLSKCSRAHQQNYKGETKEPHLLLICRGHGHRRKSSSFPPPATSSPPRTQHPAP